MSHERRCKCGCGRPPATRRARFAPGCRAREVAVNKRYWIVRSYARRRGIPFSLTRSDVRTFLVERGLFFGDRRIMREDPSLGFAVENIRVVIPPDERAWDLVNGSRGRRGVANVPATHGSELAEVRAVWGAAAPEARLAIAEWVLGQVVQLQ